MHYHFEHNKYLKHNYSQLFLFFGHRTEALLFIYLNEQNRRYNTMIESMQSVNDDVEYLLCVTELQSA